MKTISTTRARLFVGVASMFATFNRDLSAAVDRFRVAVDQANIRPAGRLPISGAALRFEDNAAGAAADAGQQGAQGATNAPATPPVDSLRQEFARLNTESQALLDTAVRENRPLSDAERTANDTRFSRMTTIKSLIEQRARFATLSILSPDEAGENRQAAPGGGAVTLPRDVPGRAEFDASEGRRPAGQNMQQQPTLDRQAFGQAVGRWAATGEMDRRFATITTATASGALLPREVTAPIVTVMGNAFREGMARVGAEPIQSNNTAEMNIPVITVSNGTDVSETATSGTDNTPVPAVINLKPSTTQSGQAWVSNLELNALGYDLIQAMLPGLVDAKEQRLEAKAMAAIIADTGVTQVVTTAATTGITYDELVDLDSKLSKRYQRQRVIILSDAAYTAAKKLKGSDGHPVLMLDPQNAQLLSFNGTPVVRSSNLEAFGTTKTIGLCVSFVGFKLRDCGQDKLQRYLNDKDKVDQTGVNLIGYNAVGYVPEAVAKLKTPNS